MMFKSAVLASMAALVTASVPVTLQDAKEVIPHQYVIVFHENTTDTSKAAHMTEIKTRLTKSSPKSKVLFEYHTVLNGYSMHDENDDVLPFLATQDSDVQYIEANQVYHALQDCALQTEATWGLVRTAQRERNLDGEYSHLANGGSGVRAYVIDTGIYLEHSEFANGLAVWGYDAVDNPSDFTDRNGHGTHVAGTVVSPNYGVSKGTTAVAVKVLGANGSGSTAGVIAGVDWSARDHQESGLPGTANMSLGGGASAAMDTATNNAVAAGLTMIVASGNSNTNACNSSPARAERAYTVNSMDNQDRRSTFSNYGPCTQIFAPGSSITSTWIGGQFAINTISGTSMAAPHVCGVAAVLQQANPTSTPEQIYAMITAESTPDKIVNADPMPTLPTPNLLIFNECI